jgi:hypothetical protein
MESVYWKLMHAIFDSSRIHPSSSLRSDLVLLPDRGNMIIAVRILLLTCIEAEMYDTSRRGGRVVSASVSGSGGPGSNPGGVTWSTCNNLGQVVHSHLLWPIKLFNLPRSIN